MSTRSNERTPGDRARALASIGVPVSLIATELGVAVDDARAQVEGVTPRRGRLLSESEVTDVLAVTEEIVDAWIRTGRLRPVPTIRHGRRFRVADVRALLGD